MHWIRAAVGRAARAHLSPLPVVKEEHVGISFAGHATVLIRYHNLKLLCDPILGMWCRGVKRETQPGLSPSELGDVDVILISNRDPDHLHLPTLAKLPRSATLIVPPKSARLVESLEFARVVALRPGQSVVHRRVDIAALPCHYGGDPALSYVLRGAGPSVFFCGDGSYTDTFAEIGRRYEPDIALLPIGGYAPASFRDRHMSPLDALHAFEDVRARVMIPIRHGTFALSYEQLHDPSRWLAELVSQRQLESFVVQMEPGESRVFVRPQDDRSSEADTRRIRREVMESEDVDLGDLEGPEERAAS